MCKLSQWKFKRTNSHQSLDKYDSLNSKIQEGGTRNVFIFYCLHFCIILMFYVYIPVLPLEGRKEKWDEGREKGRKEEWYIPVLLV